MAGCPAANAWMTNGTRSRTHRASAGDSCPWSCAALRGGGEGRPPPRGGVVPGGGERAGAGAAASPRLGARHDAGGHARPQPLGAPRVDVERVQVALVAAHECRARLESPVELSLV